MYNIMSQVMLCLVGEEVWKDVADHSREFIKEYLEAYPMVDVFNVVYVCWLCDALHVAVLCRGH